MQEICSQIMSSSCNKGISKSKFFFKIKCTQIFKIKSINEKTLNYLKLGLKTNFSQLKKTPKVTTLHCFSY